ncbi:MAG: hypothetical protein PGN08_09670 [Sphingomonas taxi]
MSIRSNRQTGRVEGHQDHALLRMAAGRRVGLAHHDRDLAARIADRPRTPFAPVDDVVVAVGGPSTSRYLVASEDATAGSVIRKAERISPFISGRSHCSL